MVHKLREERGLEAYDSVYGIFVEGQDLFPGSGFKAKSHTQIAIRNSECIAGYFRVPNSPELLSRPLGTFRRLLKVPPIQGPPEQIGLCGACGFPAGRLARPIRRSSMASVSIPSGSISAARPAPPPSCQDIPRAEQIGQADQFVGHYMQPVKRQHPASPCQPGG
jgi:hypothetical protein